MDGISKEELKAMLEVQSKSTEQLTLIAKSLQDVVAEQKKMTEMAFGNLPERVSEKVGQGCATAGERFNTVKIELDAVAKNVEKMKDDCFWIKVIIGSATLIAVVAQLIMHLTSHKL